jgi:hypothetical protein
MKTWLLVSLGIALAAAPALAAKRSAEQELLDLHRGVLEAHLKSDVDALLAPESDDYLSVNRGEISRPTKRERADRLGPYLRSTRFEVYEDMVPPVVTVSPDQKLGWVAVQVRARGVQAKPDGTQAPVEFQSAWIELYEKRSGRWVRTGNVSNFKS